MTLTASKGGVTSDPIFLALKIKLKITNTNLFIESTINEPITPLSITALGSPSTYLAEGLPNGISINTSNGTVSGTPRIDGLYNTLLKVKMNILKEKKL